MIYQQHVSAMAQKGEEQKEEEEEDEGEEDIVNYNIFKNCHLPRRSILPNST